MSALRATILHGLAEIFQVALNVDEIENEIPSLDIAEFAQAVH
jgi:hypothetical protein